MDYSKTLLIIGAGAHVPYGFPTGAQLVEFLKRLLPDYPFKSLGENESFDRRELSLLLRKWASEALSARICGADTWSPFDEVDSVKRRIIEFIDDFSLSQCATIDTYLAKLSPTEKDDRVSISIGKFLIYKIIRYFEEKNQVRFAKADWIQFLINEFMIEEKKMLEFFSNPPQIITFNYDNFFESCILNHLTKHHKLNLLQAIEKIKQLDILHVYGHVGSYLKKNEHDIRSFALDSLRVIGEDRIQPNKIQTDITKIVLNSESIYFLGFGFDSKNMSLIFDGVTPSQLSSKSISSTNYKLSKFKRRKIIDESDIDIRFPEEDTDCLLLLSEENPVFQTVARTRITI